MWRQVRTQVSVIRTIGNKMGTRGTTTGITGATGTIEVIGDSYREEEDHEENCFRVAWGFVATWDTCIRRGVKFGECK